VSEPFVGEIKLFSFPFAPRNWAFCNGTILSIAQNQALFALLGTTYGGNGIQTFALPDLRGRIPVHRSNDGSFQLGQTGGEESVTLSQSAMPVHNHLLLGTTTAGDKKIPKTTLGASPVATNFYYSPLTDTPTLLDPNSIGAAGGTQPHTNMQPYLVMNYCIALFGIFPSRN